MATINIHSSLSPSPSSPPPPPPSSSSVITSTFTEQKWRLHTSENVKLDLDSIIQTLLCAVQVPDHLKQTKPESYAPQLIALGPFHHFRPELYQIEPLKLATAKRALHRFQLREDLDDFCSKVSRSLLPRIQSYYGRHLDVQDETLAWIVAIDGLFFIEILHNEEILISSFAPCFFDSLKRKLSPHAIFGDLILLENQVPVFLLAELLQQLAAAEGNDENKINKNNNIGDELSWRLDVICRLLSPLELPEGRFPTYYRRRHLLDRLYLLVTRGEHEAAAAGGGGGGGGNSSSNVRAPTSVGILQRIATGLLKKVEDARNSYYGGGATVTEGEKDAVAGSILAGVLEKEGGGDQDDDGGGLIFAKAARARMERGKLTAGGGGGGGNNQQVLGVGEENETNLMVKLLQKATSLEFGPDENVANEVQAFAQEQERSAMTGIFHVFTMINRALEEDRCIIPSASQLKRVKIKISQLLTPQTTTPPGRTGSALCSIRFDPKSKTLYLPTFTWNPNAEVVMRNLVAYEATAKSSSLILTRYTELMHGLVRTSEDVQQLRKEGVVVGAIDDATMVEMFSGMGLSSSYPKGSTILDCSVAAINQYYNKQLKILVMRLFKKYAKVTIKYLVVVAGVLLVMVLFIQAWCSIYRCPGAVHSSVLHKTVGVLQSGVRLLLLGDGDGSGQGSS